MVLQAAREGLPHRIFLFYSNHRPEDAPFLEELRSLEQQNPNYTFVPTMTDMARSHRAWHGETGRLNKEMLSTHLKNAVSPLYYIAGPPAMVKDLHSMLGDAGIDDDDVRTEEFAGY
jgi:ferredoxin-NADP reductase